MKNAGDFGLGFMCGWVLFVALNSMPFTDSTKYKGALAVCEKSLPRDKHCEVIGIVPVSK
jgi:hypothetical protein